MPNATIIKPQSGQQEKFLASSADVVIYSGAAGGGKSFGLLLEALRHISNPKFGAVIFRRTYREVMKEGGLWGSCREIYPLAGGHSVDSKMLWSFPSGVKVSFRHLDSDNDVFGWQGVQISWDRGNAEFIDLHSGISLRQPDSVTMRSRVIWQI